VPENCRTPKQYNNRLRRLIHATGDLDLAMRYGVSRSTARGWLKQSGTDGKPVSPLAPNVLNRGPSLSVVGKTDPDHDQRANEARRDVSPDGIKRKRSLSSADNDRRESGRLSEL